MCFSTKIVQGQLVTSGVGIVERAFICPLSVGCFIHEGGDEERTYRCGHGAPSPRPRSLGTISSPSKARGIQSCSCCPIPPHSIPNSPQNFTSGAHDFTSPLSPICGDAELSLALSTAQSRMFHLHFIAFFIFLGHMR